FYEDGSGAAEIRDILDEEWGWVPDKYVDLLKAAREVGLRLVAMDLSKAEKLEIAKRQRAAGEPLTGALFEARDRRMVRIMTGELLADPGARLLALIGNDHLDVTCQPEQLEAAAGIKTRRYKFLWAADFLDPAVDKAGLTWKRVFVPLPRKSAEIDGVISVPAVRLEGHGNGTLPGPRP
ncbi:hypothetical protein ACFL2T_02915, partial [Elusimicrobiota bacterium]